MPAEGKPSAALRTGTAWPSAMIWRPDAWPPAWAPTGTVTPTVGVGSADGFGWPVQPANNRTSSPIDTALKKTFFMPGLFYMETASVWLDSWPAGSFAPSPPFAR